MKRQEIPLALGMYERMYLARKFEEKLFFLFSTRAMPGTMHQYIGQEACAVGVCSALDEDDSIVSTHRGHGHCLAKGADLNAVMAEMFAKETGCCKGMGGSMHINDFSVGMLGANGIVGGGILHAVGAAWSIKYQKQNKVAVAFFGDGASNEGTFHEAMNLASAWKLPVIFACENNLYGLSTYYRRVTNVDDLAVRAKAYDMPGMIADGMDVLDVYQKTEKAVALAKSGGGPSLIEMKTYRFCGHSRFENPSYRPESEAEEWKKRDPIDALEAQLLSADAETAEKVAKIREAVDQKIEDAVRFAEQSPDPAPDDYKKYIYA